MQAANIVVYDLGHSFGENFLRWDHSGQLCGARRWWWRDFVRLERKLGWSIWPHVAVSYSFVAAWGRK